ncbi:hypothetical protein ACIBH1_30945 [Nonomuraea sp. NPDC050663]|uniref:hypothetical protein n=1 Tax=Nonomuraea sp. NPDC050663 TaxID=3364370 RepID=UPI00378C6B67
MAQSLSSPADRIAGVLLALGATAWGVATIIVGEDVLLGIQTLDTITGMMYVTGLWAFVWRVYAAGATGTRIGRIVPLGLLVLLPGAFLVNALSFGYVTYDDFPMWLLILDACWPLSQLGTLVLGIAIAVTGRFQGMLRWLPLVAGMWFPVTMLTTIVAGATASTYVSAAWLIGTYAVIGVRLALSTPTQQDLNTGRPSVQA